MQSSSYLNTKEVVPWTEVWGKEVIADPSNSIKPMGTWPIPKGKIIDDESTFYNDAR